MKIGDIVYSEKFGKGKIICIDNDKLQLYGVRFENSNSELHDLNQRCNYYHGYWCTDNINHTIPEEIITPYKFTKQDLKAGDKLITRGGAELIYIDNDYFVEINIPTSSLLDTIELNDDLTMEDRECSIDDIVKVERPTYITVFEREEEKEEILDKKEKEYLDYVIRPFKDEIETIYKAEDFDGEYICIQTITNLGFLPPFKKGTMYKNMELNKIYILKELGLD